MTREEVYGFLAEDMKWALGNFFDNMFIAAGLDPNGADEARYIEGLVNIALEECGETIASIVESAQQAEKQAWEQWADYNGLDPDVLMVVESEGEDAN